MSDFLLAPRFRVWRYLALTLFFTIVSLNQALVGYKELMPLMGNTICLVVAGTILTYILSMYVVVKVVMKYLWSGKYIQFAAWIILCALLFTAVPNVVFCLYIEDYDLLSGSVIIDNLSAFVVFVFCIAGVIIPVFLQNWMVSSEHLSRLKIRQESSEVEQFKEQINPASFFKILNRSKLLVKPEPGKASDMLMMLGQLLRYQLYDCNRPQVLLTAEIAFLRNYLELEKLCSSGLSYAISVEGKVTGTFILPSVILPFVQGVMSAFDNRQEQWSVQVSVNREDKMVCIGLYLTGANDRKMLPEEMRKVRKRLDTLYKSRYKLTVVDGKPENEVEAILQLTNE